MSTLCPNSCRQTARIGGGAAAPPAPPRPVRLCVWLGYRPTTGHRDVSVAAPERHHVTMSTWWSRHVHWMPLMKKGFATICVKSSCACVHSSFHNNDARNDSVRLMLTWDLSLTSTRRWRLRVSRIDGLTLHCWRAEKQTSLVTWDALRFALVQGLVGRRRRGGCSKFDPYLAQVIVVWWHCQEGTIEVFKWCRMIIKTWAAQCLCPAPGQGDRLRWPFQVFRKARVPELASGTRRLAYFKRG